MRKLFPLASALLVIALLFVTFGCAKSAPSPSPSVKPAQPAASSPAAKPSPAATTKPAASPSPAAKPTPAASPKAATTESAADFFKGKTITITVPTTPGGTTDLNARIFSTFFADATGARVRILNNEAAAGMVANNDSYTAKPDGLSLGWGPTGKTLFSWQMDLPGVKYQIAPMQYLGMMSSKQNTVVSIIGGKSNLTSLKQLQESKKQIIQAAMGAASSTCLASLVAWEALGINVVVVPGYPGVAAQELAMRQGEADIQATNMENTMNGVKKGVYKVLLVLGFERESELPDVPCLGEVTKVSDKLASALRGISPIGLMMWAPPGTPPDRVKFLRDATAAALSNKGLQKNINDTSFWFGWMSGEELQKAVQRNVDTKAEFKATFDGLMKKYVKQ